MGRRFFLITLFCPLLAFAATPQKPFDLRDGDRVVFLGDTLMEREKDFGYIELMMTLRFPDRNVTFRNLGWSADTPVGISRVSFDWPKGEGEMFRVLMEQVRQVQPTVVVLGYGMASSLEDAAATEMERHADPQSNALRSGARSIAPRDQETTPRLDKFVTDYNKLIDGILELNKETRFILLSPIRHEKLPPPLPDPVRHNEMLASYTKAIEGIAEKRGCVFVDLFSETGNLEKLRGALTDNGIHLNDFGYQKILPSIAKALGWWGDVPVVFEKRQELRATVLSKNQLFFNRWRPENSTYLFLFRKHEQGKNAQEIPKFDPLIQAEEEKIAALRRKPPTATDGLLSKPTIFSNGRATVSEFVKSQNPLPDKPATPFKPQAPVHFQLADTNLEVTLWAENPLLAKPIAMNWDARGRLWIASSSVYPQIEPGQSQDDKILILEDTNGDGKADKTTVFADGLLIPTGIEPGDGGCYVGQSTELLHFKDTDGDGIADQKRVVLSGFGTEDTHHILHTLRWGPDGQLYMNQSIYIHSHIETPHGVVRLNSGGTLALRPDTMELGVTMKGLVNGWGHVWDDFGQEFQTDGAGGAGINWNIPQAMFVTYEGARRILGSVSPGAYPKFCSLELIKSERFPKEWQGNAITCDFRANRIVRLEIIDESLEGQTLEGRATRVPNSDNNLKTVQESGTRIARPSNRAGYTTKQHEFLRSTNITFRPIDVKMGPDGALYIADWSNPIIQHGEVDFRDPRRDRVHGRIWRVGYKGGKDVKAPELVKATNKELINEVLKSPNEWNQKQARRLLVERSRSEDRKKFLDELSQTLHLNYFGTNGLPLLQGLWLFQAIDESRTPVGMWMPAIQTAGGAKSTSAVYPPYLENACTSADPRVRAAAIRVVGAWAGNTPGIPSLRAGRFTDYFGYSAPVLKTFLEKAIQDDHPRVRLEALRALARIPTARSAELALSVLARSDAPRSGAQSIALRESTATDLDPFLEYTLWLTINDLAEPWAAAVESGAWKIEGREKQLQYALKAIEPKLATKLMAKVIGNKPLPRDGSGGMIELIGQAGGPRELRKLFDQVLSGGFTDEATASALNWLSEAARLRNAKPSGDLSGVTQLIDHSRGREPAGDSNGRSSIAAATDVRAPAAKLAGSWKLQSVAPQLIKLAGDANASSTIREAAIEGLRELGGPSAIGALRDLTSDNNDAVRRNAAAALGSADLNGSMSQIISVLSGIKKEEDALTLWRSLLVGRESAAAFSPVIGKTNLPETVARAGVRAARETGRTEPTLVMALNKAGGLSDPSTALTDDEIHGIAYNVTKGDPASGEKVYRSKQLGCTTCHAIGGAGGKVGPDLTSLGASTPVVDYIVESVLLPNKKVKEGFNSVQITTRDDEDIAGNLVREDNEQIILRDTTAKEVSIPKRNVAARKMGGSLMPSGLVDFISPQERLDLYAFLAQLGKPGSFDATKQNVARVWRLNSKVGTVNADEMLKSDLHGKDWTPLYSTANGTLPKEDVLAELTSKESTVWLASRFQTAKSGPTKFHISGTASPKAWIDGKPIGDGDGNLSVELLAGAHTFFIKVTTTDIAQGIRLESNDATFLVE